MRAKHLTATMQGVRFAQGKRRVTYVHLMFDAHQIIFAENVASESFYPGPMSLTMMGLSSRIELFELFPELKADTICRSHIMREYGDTARSIVKKKELPDLLVAHTTHGSTRQLTASHG